MKWMVNSILENMIRIFFSHFHLCNLSNLTAMFPIVKTSLYLKHLWFYLFNNALDGFIEIEFLVKTMIMFTTTKASLFDWKI
jgi:hypothetical protein